MEEHIIRVVVLLYKVGAVGSNFIEKVKSRVLLERNVKKIRFKKHYQVKFDFNLLSGLCSVYEIPLCNMCELPGGEGRGLASWAVGDIVFENGSFQGINGYIIESQEEDWDPKV